MQGLANGLSDVMINGGNYTELLGYMSEILKGVPTDKIGQVVEIFSNTDWTD
jgi:hypothetical protein